jgi:hypothetical protein
MSGRVKPRSITWTGPVVIPVPSRNAGGTVLTTAGTVAWSPQEQEQTGVDEQIRGQCADRVRGPNRSASRSTGT